MEISANIQNNILTCKLSGELDHHSAKEVKDLVETVIKNRGVKNLIFDFSALKFMDSSGIGVIIGRYKLISSLGGQVAIVSQNRVIDRLLTMSGINKLIPVYSRLEEAEITFEEEIS